MRRQKNKCYLLLLPFLCFFLCAEHASAQKVIEITPREFVSKVYDYKSGSSWKYQGSKPAIVDFYATWCMPCRVLKPRLKKIAEKYGDKIVVYSIDAETAPNLAAMLGVQGYPTLLFIPADNTIPTMSVGALSLDDLTRGVEEILLPSIKRLKK